MGFLEQGLNYMARSQYTHLALPQFVIMASTHLSILRDAAMIGNDFLGVTNTADSKTDFRQQFKEYLKKYYDILLDKYYARLLSTVQPTTWQYVLSDRKCRVQKDQEKSRII